MSSEELEASTKSARSDVEQVRKTSSTVQMEPPYPKIRSHHPHPHLLNTTDKALQLQRRIRGRGANGAPMAQFTSCSLIALVIERGLYSARPLPLFDIFRLLASACAPTTLGPSACPFDAGTVGANAPANGGSESQDSAAPLAPPAFTVC